MANVRIRVLLRGLTARLRAALNNPAPLMRQLGGLMVAQSGKAFDESRLGEYEWPKRYPNMGDGSHFVNIAGIVSDFAQGKEPPKRRFESRPPLLDTGWLRRTMKDETKSMHLLNKFEVQVGSSDPRANQHQWGGQTEQFVTDAVRDNLAKFLKGGPSWKRKRTKTYRGTIDLGTFGTHGWERKEVKTFEPKVREVKTDKATGYSGTLTRRDRFGERLGFLFRSRVLITKVNQRPFVGIPDDLREKLLATTASYFSDQGGQGNG